MGKLSQCVFKWDEDDLQLLTTAKREEMILQGVVNLSEKDVRRNLSSTELALHCKRVTRGTEETQTLISGLIQSLDGPKGCDTLGVPLFESERIAEVWRVQQQHVSCIQDPEGVHLYTQTGTLKKGGVSLPVYRCARGSTSLESFHLHMNRFIPGRKRYITHTAIPSNSIKFYIIDPTIPALECHPEPVPPILPIPSMADYEKMLEDTCRGTYGIFIQTISYN